MTITKNILLILMGFMIISGCGKKDDVTPETSVTNTLNGSWVTTDGYVKVDGTDVSGNYTNFKITFATTNNGDHIYTVINGGYAFADINTDLWSFEGSGFTTIKRSDDVLMSFAIKDGFLTLAFTISDPVQDGRVNGLFGNFEMKLKKK